MQLEKLSTKLRTASDPGGVSTREETRPIEADVNKDRVKKCQEIDGRKNSKKESSTDCECGGKKSYSVQTGNFSLVKIQIETCPQLTDKNCQPSANACSISTCKTGFNPKFKNKSGIANRATYNSTEPETENNFKKINKSGNRHCGNKSIPQNGSKFTKSKSAAAKTSKKDAQQSVKSLEKCKSCEKIESLDKPSLACKKPPCSPFKKLKRSSLTIEPDKITVNLSKYSPCASRLAASSKILTSTSPTSPESPLRAVRSRSPSNFDNRLARDVSIEKSTIQASLSLNIQQYQKSNSAPRSKSVGDSCVTSPTSEETTTSYSPTSTEILFLEEATSMLESRTSFNTKGTDAHINSLAKCAQKARKITLETKC
ncbi:uncharacterized protein LOC105687941 [Athalia rosae]|uniref:uncharacterized protein LOC105687941 n=1 Tax=Athalia rosae TaxID=37344 RepID=UPI002034A0A0|nr:uncharacterized protein LOC105687941 [Athalia rosae]